MKEPVVPSPKKPRRKFDPSFKKEAVALWLKSGKTAETVAQELGITAGKLYTWKCLFAPAGTPGRPSTTDLEVQNAALRRENEYLRQQRDILKKTLGILSEPPPNGMNGSPP